MEMNVFTATGFDLSTLTHAVNQFPHVPTRLGQLGIFGQQGISTTSAMVEMQNDSLTLVPTKPRGAPATPVTPGRRNQRPIQAQHLPTTVSVLADEVQNLRAFGTEDELITARNWLNRKMQTARRNIEVTLEWQRIGAMKGQVLDSDGSTVLLDLYSEFGVAQQTVDMALNSDTTKVLIKCLEAKRRVEDELGALMYTDLRVECSSEFFDAFISHPMVRDAYAYYQAQFKSSDVRKGFRFADMLWEEYRGSVGATRFIEAKAAYVIPEGVPELFAHLSAPAPYTDTVNTIGYPFYAAIEEMDFKKGFMVEMQSNPLIFNTRPLAVVKLTTP